MSQKIVLLTGASKGIGREIAIAALEDGAHVFAVARNQEMLITLKNISPDNVTCIVGDITDPSTREGIKREIEKIGHLDFLINNAGFAKGIDLQNDTLENIESMINLNVVSLIDLTRLMLPYLHNSKKGRVMNISSGFGVISFPFMATYVASKFAVIGFTQSLNIELASSSVSASAYCPAKVLTGFDNAALGPVMRAILNRIADTPQKMGRAIWKKRNRKKTVIYPTLFSFMAYLGKLVPDCIYLGGMGLLVKLRNRKRK